MNFFEESGEEDLCESWINFSRESDEELRLYLSLVLVSPARFGLVSSYIVNLAP